MKGQRVLVTGGCGYVGCALVPMLITKGYKVRIFDKLVFGDKGIPPTLRDLVEIIQGDVYDFDDRVLDGVDSVVHLAGLSNDPTADFNPEANMLINVEGTKRVADACVKRKVKRFLFASSCSIYYSLSPYTGMLTETSEISPTAPYSLSKKLAEEYLFSLASDDFCPSFLRKGTIFGWSPRMRYDLVVNVFTKHAYQKGSLTVHNGGEIWRPLLSIGDACRAYIALLEAPEEKIRGQAFNLLHKNYRILELAHWISHVLRQYKPVIVNVEYNSSVPPRSYQVSAEKIKQTLGFTADVGISREVLKMWDRIVHGPATQDLEDPKYYNIKWLKQLVEAEERHKQIGNLFPKKSE